VKQSSGTSEPSGAGRRARVFSVRVVSVVTALIVACVVVLSGAGIAGASSPSPSASNGKVVLRIGSLEEPDGLNWFTAYSNASYYVWPLTYDFLLGYGEESKAVPGLATELPSQENGGISADGKVWTYRLRDNARWDDGQPVTADDVAFTFNLTLDQAPSRLTFVEDVEAVDAHTVRITCSRPKADLPRLYVPILPKHVWEKLTPAEAATRFANEPPIVGSGPFKIVEWKHGSYLRFKRNPYYWGKKPTISEIVWSFYKNANTLVEDLKLGSVDVAVGVEANEFHRLSETPGVQTWPFVYYNWDYVCFNCSDSKLSTGHPALRDWRFRNALNYAIDREKLCDIAYRGLAEPGYTIVPPKQWNDPDFHWEPTAEQAYRLDFSRADQLLTQAGYRKDVTGKRLDKQHKPIKLRVFAQTDQPAAQTEARLLCGWLEELGIDTDLQVLGAAALSGAVWNFKGDQYAPDFDLELNNWMGSVDPTITMSFFTTSGIGVFNEPGWSHAEYDKVVSQMLTTIDPHARKPLIDKLQQIMYQQSPWIVLTHPYYLEAFSTDRWTGWPEANNGHDAPIATYSINRYLDLRPLETSTTQSESNMSLIALIILVVAVLVVVAIVVFLRRRKLGIEE